MTPAEAISTIPPGPWAVGVSGGADSVALLALLRDRSDLSLYVAHLDHETRPGASAADAAFVADLAARWDLPYTVAKLSEFTIDETNSSSRYRAARFALFRRVVTSHGLHGVLLAHHADDQAETVLLRLLRGTGPLGLGGIRPRAHIDGLTVLHPLLDVSRTALRHELARRQLSWREDTSNVSPQYLRNRVRAALADAPELSASLIALGSACAACRTALDQIAPRLPAQFPASALHDIPAPLAHHAARRWLRDRGLDADDLGPAVLRRLCAMATDAASPPRQHFPGGLLVRRRRGVIFIDPPAGSPAPS